MASLFSVVDPSWELIDPNPDIHELFNGFNETFFGGKLSSVYVQWSPRMTLCAGLCKFHPRNRECSIHLSKPLLSLRPRKDLVETLLHEMIHAYLFIADGNRERESHGPRFHEHMYRINKMTGAKISVYHTFHDEVKHFKTHWWKCNGPCQHRHPFYGLVKRSMNRAPGPNDFWFKDHQKNCGGTFVKIKEPSPKKAVKRKTEATSSQSQKSQKTQKTKEEGKTRKDEGNENKNKITNYFHSPTKTPSATATSSTASSSSILESPPAAAKAPENLSNINTVEPFAGRGFVLGSIGNNSSTAVVSSESKTSFAKSLFGPSSTSTEVTGNKLGGTSSQSQPVRRGDHPLLAKWRQNENRKDATSLSNGLGFRKPESVPMPSLSDIWETFGAPASSASASGSNVPSSSTSALKKSNVVNSAPTSSNLPSSSVSALKKSKAIEVIDLD